MRLVWTGKASSDLARLHEFLAEVNPRAAAEVVRRLVAAPRRLATTPRVGEQLAEFEPREIRRVLAGDYEIRYEISEATVYVLRLWHTLENR
jgi:plasmid stabilization system protein ParE